MNQSAATSASVFPHPLRQFTPRQGRRILLLFPEFSYSFGTFNHAFPLMNVKAFMPPQGILLVAALLPKGWETRFVDENVRAATAEDFEWADVVFTTGMHIQRTQIYRPEALYARYDYNAAHTYPHRMLPTQPWRQLTARNLRRGLRILARVIWNVGLRSDYRRVFWHMGAKQMRQGHFETFFQVAMVGYHLITYARECLEGKLQPSNYSKRVSGRTEPPAGDRRVADANGHEPMDPVSLRAET